MIGIPGLLDTVQPAIIVSDTPSGAERSPPAELRSTAKRVTHDSSSAARRETHGSSTEPAILHRRLIDVAGGNRALRLECDGHVDRICVGARLRRRLVPDLTVNGQRLRAAIAGTGH